PDGGSAMTVTSAARAEAEGWPVLAEIVQYGTVAGPDSTLQHQPARAIENACERAGLSVSDIELFELNEAFSSVGIHSTRELGADPADVNTKGGASRSVTPSGYRAVAWC